VQAIIAAAQKATMPLFSNIAHNITLVKGFESRTAAMRKPFRSTKVNPSDKNI